MKQLNWWQYSLVLLACIPVGIGIGWIFAVIYAL